MVCIGDRRGGIAIVNWEPACRRFHLPGEGFLKARDIVTKIAIVVVLRLGAARQTAVVINPDVAPT